MPAKPGEGQQTTSLGVVSLHQLTMQDQTYLFLITDLHSTSCGLLDALLRNPKHPGPKTSQHQTDDGERPRDELQAITVP